MQQSAPGIHHRRPKAPPPAAANPPVDATDAAPAPLAGQPVEDQLPDDWALKRGCLITSASPLDWAVAPYFSVHSSVLSQGYGRLASRSESDATGLALAFERSLLHWRHPAQRLPPVLLKQLTSPAIGNSAEKEYAESLNDAWDAALRSLFSALRDGRLPYFYCRAEPPSQREASVAMASGFTVLWRNASVSHDDQPYAGHLPPLPIGWAATDDRSCYAVISPSSRGLRSALEKHGVAFEMPLAPASMRGGSTATRAVRGGGGEAAAAAPSTRPSRRSPVPNAPGDAGADDDRTLAGLNREFQDEVQPDSELGQQLSLANLDYKTGSTLVVQGRAALHALHEFLINAKPSPQTAHPYFLTLQLLAPQPFVNGVPHAPRVVYQRGRGACGSMDASDRASDDIVGTAMTDDTIRFEDGERDGGAILLPSAYRKLVSVLLRAQREGFEMHLQPDSGGASGDAVNVQPSSPAATPLDLLNFTSARRPQPLADIRVGDNTLPTESCDLRPECHERSSEPKARIISRLRFSGGELRVI